MEQWTAKILYSFKGLKDGANPVARIVFDAAGNIYGTTALGGTTKGRGTVFELATLGNSNYVHTILWTFSGTDGANPYGSLNLDSEAVTFTAVVTSSMGAPPDGETVRFMKGTTVLGTGALSGGSATFTTSTFPVGANYIKAVYGGDSKFVVSTSITVKQVVKKAATGVGGARGSGRVAYPCAFCAQEPAPE